MFRVLLVERSKEHTDRNTYLSRLLERGRVNVRRLPTAVTNSPNDVTSRSPTYSLELAAFLSGARLGSYEGLKPIFPRVI
jgi:hypothetical protein